MSAARSDSFTSQVVCYVSTGKGALVDAHDTDAKSKTPPRGTTTVQSATFILDFINLKREDEVCPAGQAKHAQQTRQSMPYRTDRACSAEQAKHAQQEAHLKPGSDIKMLLHVGAQHLVDNDRPEESRVLGQILQNRHKQLSLIAQAMQHFVCWRSRDISTSVQHCMTLRKPE